MAAGRYQFCGFTLDAVERRLFAGEVPVELHSRYARARRRPLTRTTAAIR